MVNMCDIILCGFNYNMDDMMDRNFSGTDQPSCVLTLSIKYRPSWQCYQHLANSK